ncbi:unnamed protein product [Cochlearia groenlandica]
MEKQIINKKKRVFSLEPNKNPSQNFTSKYTSHLFIALQKLKMNKNSSQINQQTVKHEVDMALALSTQEFAWSRFLLQKLSSSKNQTTSTSSSSHQIMIQERSYEEEEEEGEEIEEKLSELKKLLPGGQEMNVEEMLSEVCNYITCLELQVIALKSIVQENT